MLVLGQAPGGALSARRCSLTSPPKFSNPNPPLFSSRRPSRFFSNVNPSKSLNITLVKANGGVDSASSTAKQGFSASSPPPPPSSSHLKNSFYSHNPLHHSSPIGYITTPYPHITYAQMFKHCVFVAANFRFREWIHIPCTPPQEQ
ncbi:hypothetical protein ACFX19_043690 [Malus domestica]